MRYTITLLLALFLSVTSGIAQWTNKTLNFGGYNREYRIYLPSGYSSSGFYPLVLTLHGLGDNMTNFSGIGMNNIADTAKFIVVVPQAISDPVLGATAWNSGAGMYGIYPNPTIDDVGFLNALIDSTGVNYPVNKNRIYVCGFSMGGYMTERLACQLSNKLAAVASMAGTIGNGIASCNPTRIIPVAHFHGTSDQTVPYTSNTSGIDVDSLIKFWVNKNGCNPNAVHVTLPNTANDGYTVDHYTYSGTVANSIVEHFKVNGADHIWLSLPANDISYALEAWKFFSRFQLGATTGIANLEKDQTITISPNPANEQINIVTPFESSEITLTDVTGKTVLRKSIDRKDVISLVALNTSGIYFVKITSTEGTCYQKLMVIK